MACVRHVNSVRTILSRTYIFGQKLPQLQTSHHGLHTRPLLANTRGLWLRVSPTNTCQRLPVATCGITAIRHSSADQLTSMPGYIPDVPPVPVDTEELVQQLNALGEPTLVSQGLGGWSPSGVVQTILEHIHVTFDLPWWGSIVVMTLALRMIMFPLVILTQKNTANMNNHMPTVQRLQQKFSNYRAAGNHLDAARASQDLAEYMQRNKLNPFKTMLTPLVQMPIFMSVFFGFRTMVNLPVESMKMGGLFWFSDLTIVDPYYALPIITSATLALTLEVGSDGMKANNMNPIMKVIVRAMPLIMFPVILNFPAAMLVYWLTTNFFSLCQVLFLKIPNVRAYFNIPKIVKHDQSYITPKKGFIEGFRESMSNASITAEVQNRERMEAMKFKEAGKGAIQKTYKSNPKLTKKS